MADAADGPGESAGLITEDQIRDAFRANNGRASVRLTRAVARTTMDILFRANCDEHTRLSLVVANQKISGLALAKGNQLSSSSHHAAYAPQPPSHTSRLALGKDGHFVLCRAG
jgi:hypothetical protein